MRILFWTGKFWPEIGGTATFATRLLPVLKLRGYEILVVAAKSIPNQSSQDTFKGIPVKRFPFRDPNTYRMIDSLSSMKRTMSILKREFSPDIIHLSTVDIANFFHLETQQVHFSPVLVTLHSFQDPTVLAHNKHSTVEEQVLNSANWVTGVSHSVMDQARILEPGIIPRSSVIHNGLDFPPILPKPLPIDPPILLYLGRLVKEKGIDVALSAFPRILTRFPKTRMVIAGDGPERLSLDQQARSLGIRDSVDFLGWVSPDDVSDLINTASVVVIPSRCEESFGFVALEAGLMARPVVATRVGGLQEVIIHSKTGLFVRNEDSLELCHAINSLLGDFPTAEKIGQAARCHVIENFSLQRCVNAYDALYQAIRNEFDTQCAKRAHGSYLN